MLFGLTVICASAGTRTDFLVPLAFFPLGLETLENK